MTMIAVGQGLRGIANRGMGAVAKAESVEEQQRMGIEAQKTAAEAQTMGTGAGIGGMVWCGPARTRREQRLRKPSAHLTRQYKELGNYVGLQGVEALPLLPQLSGAETLARRTQQSRPP